MATRSIYVPLEPEELRLLAAMAKAQHRPNVHYQAAHLISEALDRWRVEQALERSLQGGELEEEAVA